MTSGERPARWPGAPAGRRAEGRRPAVQPTFAIATSLLLAAALGAAASAHAADGDRHCLGGVCRETCLQQVCLFVSANESFGLIDAENDFDVPIGIQVHFKRLVNLDPYPRPPVRAVIPARKSSQVVRLKVIDPGRPGSFPFEWRFTYGDPTATHDPRARYRLPFGGHEARVLTQGQNGSFTHNGTSAYSYDFGMPVGTPILAARMGRVVEVSDGHSKSGVSPDFLDKANAVTVIHGDGTFATYAHLDPGAGVRRGMRVAVGDVLGRSGNTGFSTGPHLHFSVWKATSTGSTTVPIRFRHESDPRGFVPSEGTAYAPTCHRDGVPCRSGELPARPASWGPPPQQKAEDGTCRCSNGAVITVDLPCHMVCP